ncbi:MULTISPECIES: cytochrome c [unclassified Arcicella]|uniref:c-type cytochrome n=1 Tax=unclassified Arcicella TaxID=2644986 RepID=UPI0028660589|nr:MULTISPECIES: cytochrome c [unclassified Arcicella]MDR6561205.1 mono/diheme cytochrome c family protein [Arcicella sp. BE51]MDR6811089.1 mono/diheme cytochrome c family protein [Arcicella sp. BE140]MDR6822439.1 mono/diheme cytochrome c family protein [Arcicella sp. BE139]
MSTRYITHKLGFALCLITLFAMTACDSKEEIKRKQYFVDGQALYKMHCANCHQEKGEGLAGLYPPIAGSDFLTKNKELVLCSMRNGLMDTIVVNGKTYHQPMPANTQLQALDVAEIATFIYNEWGGEKTITNVKDVEKILKTCKNKVE